MPRHKIVAIVSILIFICSCVALLGGVGLGFGLRDAFDQLTANRSVNETTKETAISPPAGRPDGRNRLLLEDDFSRPRWEIGSDADHDKKYDDGQYVITAHVDNFSFWSLAGESFENFAVEIETTQLAGPDDNDYGLILRHQDDANFYTFEISGDGFYAFSKLVEDEYLEIIPWQESEAIRHGDQKNKLRVEAKGPNFTFYVNDQRLDGAIDPEFNRGDIGLITGAFDEPGVSIAFDNLKVWAAE